MRTKSTNFLQAIVLFDGLIYVIIGLLLFISPMFVLKLFAENISENWIDLVRDHELVAPLYYITRGMASLLLASGLSFILPLFDPLRYRGLIYYLGLIFPFLASIIFLKNGIFFIFMEKHPGSETADVITKQSEPSGHLVLLVLGIIFAMVFILSIIGLIITNKQSKEGVE